MTMLAPPALAEALAARGYATLTPVQDAVLGADAAGRDLLVSAQTGSGKTVAFGLAIAPQLLAGDATDGGPLPRGLVIAPTRELALQVAREFDWLYAATGIGIATCVGGMDYRTERRALDRGPALVVGTPGRLRDHVERGSLRLDAIRAVVLDEADEMLDLGFREDLEFLLAAAPEGRRTLMFSATVPRAIEDLARVYQREALRIVARGESSQHGDIAYRALSVGNRDREHAILNLLRLHDARVALVFCKTRAAVAHLAARMGNRGLNAVVLSGELGQNERLHALQALRDGRARICVATDVAARGIDLPGLDLVVHADLPSNPETLLHRSGRTGRAGQKGVSVLIVAPSDTRKAQRLLGLAKVTAEWGKPPSAAEVQAADDARLGAHEALALPVTEDEEALVEDLVATRGPRALAAAVVRLWRAGRSAPDVLQDEVEPPEPRGAPAPRPEFGPSVWFALGIGHADRAEARWLLPKVCRACDITRDSVGAIRVRESETQIEIAAAAAGRLPAEIEIDEGLVLRRLEGVPEVGARPSARRNEGRPEGRAPARGGTERKPARRAAEGDEGKWQPRPDRPARREPDDRPAAKPWAAKPPRASDRPRPTEVAEHPRSGTAHEERPQREDRPPREAGRATDRPGKPASARPRPAWPDRAERPARPPREEWKREDRPAREDRPPRADRPQREDRPSRAERPARGDTRTERPRGEWPKADRPRDDKPRDERPGRPARPPGGPGSRPPRAAPAEGEAAPRKPRLSAEEKERRRSDALSGRTGGPEARPARFAKPKGPDPRDPGQSLRRPGKPPTGKPGAPRPRPAGGPRGGAPKGGGSKPRT
jgi:ATP-dependent RNA helicase DeaD